MQGIFISPDPCHQLPSNVTKWYQSNLLLDYYCRIAVNGRCQLWKRQSTALAQGDASAKFNTFSSHIPTSWQGFTNVSTGFAGLRFAKFSQNPSTKPIIPTNFLQFRLIWAYLAHFLWNKLKRKSLKLPCFTTPAVIAITFLFSNDWWEVICTPLSVT